MKVQLHLSREEVKGLGQVCEYVLKRHELDELKHDPVLWMLVLAVHDGYQKLLKKHQQMAWSIQLKTRISLSLECCLAILTLESDGEFEAFSATSYERNLINQLITHVHQHYLA